MFFKFSTLLTWIFSQSQTVSGAHKQEVSGFVGSWLFVTYREPLIDPKTCLERFRDAIRLFLIDFGCVGHVYRWIWGVYTLLNIPQRLRIAECGCGMNTLFKGPLTPCITKHHGPKHRFPGISQTMTYQTRNSITTGTERIKLLG